MSSSQRPSRAGLALTTSIYTAPNQLTVVQFRFVLMPFGDLPAVHACRWFVKTGAVLAAAYEAVEADKLTDHPKQGTLQKVLMGIVTLQPVSQLSLNTLPSYLVFV